MTTPTTDERFLSRALDLAENGLFSTSPNPRVGCLIRKNGRTIAEGWHQSSGTPHAEAMAVKQLNGKDATAAEVFVNLEPCAHQAKTPPCTAALLALKPARVIIATTDPNPQVSGKGIATLRQAGITVSQLSPPSPVFARALELNIGFMSRFIRRRPWLRIKIAATLDGKTALADGRSRWISNAASRTDAHRLRARSCALLTGIGTALQDDPALTVRHVATPRQPLRILADSTLKAQPPMKIFADSNALLVTAQDENTAAKIFPQVKTLSLPNNDGKVDFLRLMQTLAEMGINEVTTEAGRKINGALLAAGLVDEIVLYIAARVFGGNSLDMLATETPASPEEAQRFELHDVQRLPADGLKVIYRKPKVLSEIHQCLNHSD